MTQRKITELTPEQEALMPSSTWNTAVNPLVHVSMDQVIQANELTLSEVEDQFNLWQVLDDPTFFPEWQDDLPELSESEIQALDRVKTEFLSFSMHVVNEVKFWL
jgi:hypothetical protein